MTPEYIHLPSEGALPALVQQPFRAVVVVEETVTEDWRQKVSQWLVASGCLYMMAWGQECSLWDDSVDYAMLDAFDYGDIPDERFVMTTWHEDETISEVFWFAANCADHASVELLTTVILDISLAPRRQEMLTLFANAISETAPPTV